MKRPAVAVVQARMGASRMPNKMMLWLHGFPVIEWVFKRVVMAREIDRIVFALPNSNEDDVLAQHLINIGAFVYRGDQDDVLNRCYNAALLYQAQTVVRICADNPFVSGSEIDRLINFFKTGNYDYAYNHIPRNNRYPDGLGAEMTHFSVLSRIEKQAIKPDHREHMFNYIWDNLDNFRVGTCDPLDDAIAYPDLKLDMDTPGDYAWLLRLPVRPEMSARQVVAAALLNPRSLKD